jgi:hypothetical protein
MFWGYRYQSIQLLVLGFSSSAYLASMELHDAEDRIAIAIKVRATGCLGGD